MNHQIFGQNAQLDSWERLVQAEEASGRFAALPAWKREALFGAHDRLITLDRITRFKPEAVDVGDLQSWMSVNARSPSDADLLMQALNRLLIRSVLLGIRECEHQVRVQPPTVPIIH